MKLSCTHRVIVVCTLLFTGNLFVMAAILLERNLQSVANYLIISLAFADLMVACLVMPLGAVYEVCMTSLYIKPRVITVQPASHKYRTGCATREILQT